MAVLTAGAGFAFFLSFVCGMMKTSDAYLGAVERVRASRTVNDTLGAPISEGFFISGNINLSGPSGNAQLSIPISGPKGNATIYVEATKSLGRWHFKHVIVEFAHTRERVELGDGAPSEDPTH